MINVWGTFPWYSSTSYLPANFALNNTPGYEAIDAWLKIEGDGKMWLYLDIDSLYVGQDGIDPSVDFDAIDRGDIQGKALDSPDPTTGLTRYLINPGAPT